METNQQVLEKVLVERRQSKTIARGSMMEGIVGLAAGVIAIIGLAGALPEMMLSIASIALGAGLIIEAGAVMGRFSSIVQDIGESAADLSITPGGTSVETIAGISGVTLGIIALLGINSMALNSIAVIIFGAAIAFGAGSIAMINSLQASRTMKNQFAKNVMISISAASADIRTLGGLGALAVGVLAVIGINPTILALSGLLAISGILFLETLSQGGNSLSILRR